MLEHPYTSDTEPPSQKVSSRKHHAGDGDDVESQRLRIVKERLRIEEERLTKAKVHSSVVKMLYLSLTDSVFCPKELLRAHKFLIQMNELNCLRFFVPFFNPFSLRLILNI